MNGWSNWAGNAVAPAATVVRPHDVDELRDALAGAATNGRTVRVAGGGHSFAALVPTDDVVVDLAALCGVLDVDRAGRRAWVGAGSPIHSLGAPLWAHGLSLANQGDIDVQTIGGAVATGTHGTGPGLPCLSAAVDGVRIVLADGTFVECDRERHPDLFAAARLSLGAIGVVTELRLQLVDAYHLRERTWSEPAGACLARLAAHVAATRHFEFFWYAGRDRCFAKALHPHPGPPGQDDAAGDATGDDHGGGRGRVRVDRAYRVFPSVRSDRFVEMEFAVPAERGPACFEELRRLYLDHHADVTWPVEYRTLAADDTWIGPASGRATVTLSVHQAVGLDHRPLFADAEAVFRNHGGRPHWGKLHGFDGADLAAAHPGWERFWSVVDDHDPRRRFRNPYLTAWRP